MAGQIKATPDELRSKALAIEEKKEQSRTAVNQIETIIYGLSDFFEGESQKAIEDEFTKLKPIIEQFYEYLEACKKSLEASASTFEEIDKGLASSFRT